MWRNEALFVALISGFVISMALGIRTANADDRREQDAPTVAEATKALDGRVLRLLRRIGFRSLPDQASPAVAEGATGDVFQPASTRVLVEDRSVTGVVSATPGGDTVVSSDRVRSSNVLRQPRLTRPDAVAPAPQQFANPLRAATTPVPSRSSRLSVSDSGPVASKSRSQSAGEPSHEAPTADGPTTVHLEDRVQTQEPERPSGVAANGEGTGERIPSFKIGPSSRRTAQFRQDKTSLSNSAPSASNAMRETLRREPHARPQSTRQKSLPSTFQSSQPLVTPSTAPGKFRQNGSRPPRESTIAPSLAKEPGRLAQDTSLQPQSTILSKAKSTPSPSERETQKIALAGNVAPSDPGQPSLRREADTAQAIVPTEEERSSKRVPKATLRKSLPSTQSVVPANSLRDGTAVASASKRAPFTAPKLLLPQDEPEVKPLPALRPSMRLAVRESRMIRSPENIVSVVSGNDAVCEVVQLNARDLAVVGKSQGITKIEIWHDKQGISRASHVVAIGPDQAFEIPEEDRNQGVHKLVSYLFPDSQVELISEEDRVVVRGRASSRRQAIDILSTIRRSQLVPVVDELRVQDD